MTSNLQHGLYVEHMSLVMEVQKLPHIISLKFCFHSYKTMLVVALCARPAHARSLIDIFFTRAVYIHMQ